MYVAGTIGGGGGGGGGLIKKVRQLFKEKYGLFIILKVQEHTVVSNIWIRIFFFFFWGVGGGWGVDFG